MDENLIRTLGESQKETDIVRLPDGSEVLLSAYGGRILGLFAGGDSRNFYWTHPNLQNSDTAREFLCSDQWQNIGGDRAWLAPEIDIFFPKFPDRSVYHQPRSLDPGSYRVENIDGALQMAMEFEVTPTRHGAPVRLRLSKLVESAANPLRYERVWKELDGIQYAGYSLSSVLEFASEPAPAVSIGLWNLVQMPHGGEMILPTYGKTAAHVFFGDIPEGDLLSTPYAVRYIMRAKGEQKIGLRAISSTGRVGYYYESEGIAQLVIRNFFVNPSGEYVDAPWADPDDVGFGVQACNVNSQLGSFSELEYHIPAIGVGHPRAEDAAQVWAYRGTREQIAIVAKELLGAAAAREA